MTDYDPTDYDDFGAAFDAAETDAEKAQALDHFDPTVDVDAPASVHTERVTTERQPETNPFEIGDPVMDAAQGRAMIVLNAPEQNVAEWSNNNGYELQENYANGKFDPEPDEHVVECVYVSDVRSEPSKSYTFPVSRVVLIDAHHADDGRRVADRVTVDVLERLFGAAIDSDIGASVADVNALAHKAGVGDEARSLAEELAKADREAPSITADE